jgi:peroxiredoxin (alkyl hydroperoxide reductase subunit C)
MIKVGQKAPEFSCPVVEGSTVKQQYCLDDLGNTYKVIFFYPADFTFVCPTELHAFQSKLDAFKKRNAVVVGVSTDSVESHQKWLKTPKKEGGVEGITYPLVADDCKKMALDYGVLDDASGMALRGLFVLDKDNIVQASIIHNMPLGRNIDEALRILDSLQFHEKHGQVCPANWETGQTALDATTEGVKKYFSK